MKAVIFEGREQMRVDEVPTPEPGPREVLLKVAACGICGGDARSYFLSDAFTGQSRIPGHEPAGVIAAAGRDVLGWREGDRVALAADIHCGECWYCKHELFNMCDKLRILGKHVNGALAEYMLLSEDILRHGIVNLVPPKLGLVAAAVSEPLCSILASHDELRIKAGETVLIIGAGPMGVMHLVLLKARGANVWITDTSETRLGMARSRFGAQTLRHDEAPAYPGPDVVIAAAPSGTAVQRAIAVVRKRGRVGLFGGLPASQAEMPLDVNRIHYSELRIVGNFSYHPSYHKRALELLADGSIPFNELITRYKIEDTRQGLHDIRDGNVLKAVVVPDGGAKL